MNLHTLLQNLIRILQAQQLPLGMCFLILVFYFIGRYQKRRNSGIRKVSGDNVMFLSSRDVSLVQSAIDRTSELEAPHKEAYIQQIGYRLEYFSKELKSSDKWEKILGVTALCSSALSSFVTGSGFFGEWTVGLSFSVTSIGAVSLAINQFNGFERRTTAYMGTAEKVRLELMQYVGASSEYEGLSVSDAYDKFAAQTDGILGEHIKAQIALTKRKNDNKKTEETPHE